jgi:pimeloyl-ACP methyl ester carboxylesterase
MDWIRQDLKDNPLLPGQKIVLVGHSGGGAIVTNLTGMLENENYDVEAVVTMGSPVANYDQAAQYADIHEIRDHRDYIGLPIIRSAEGAQMFPYSVNPMLSLVGSELLARNPRPNTTHTTTQAKTDPGAFMAPHSSYHTNPVVADILGQYSSQCNLVPQPDAAVPEGAR